MPTEDVIQGISQSAMKSSVRREKVHGNNTVGKFKIALPLIYVFPLQLLKCFAQVSMYWFQFKLYLTGFTNT